jgi:hypothetical protein
VLGWLCTLLSVPTLQPDPKLLSHVPYGPYPAVSTIYVCAAVWLQLQAYDVSTAKVRTRGKQVDTGGLDQELCHEVQGRGIKLKAAGQVHSHVLLRARKEQKASNKS